MSDDYLDTNDITDASLVVDDSEAVGYGAVAAAIPPYLSPTEILPSPKKIEVPGLKELMEAYEKFVSYNTGWTGDLIEGEPERVHQALNAVIGDNIPLWIAFYAYYSKHEINKFSGGDLEDAMENDKYAETKPGRDTYVDPKILENEFSRIVLGGLLMHEFVHTRHKRSDFLQWQEGEAHAIEWFLYYRKFDDCALEDECASRMFEIEEIMRNHQYDPSSKRGMYELGLRKYWTDAFNKGYVKMEQLCRKIRNIPAPNDAPAELAGLTSQKAKLMVAEFVSKRPADRSIELKGIETWIEQNLPSLNPPMPYYEM